MAKHYYAVANGFKPGIYETWAECQKQVNHFSGAKYKSFLTHAGAVKYLSDNLVQTQPNKTSSARKRLKRKKKVSPKLDASHKSGPVQITYMQPKRKLQRNSWTKEVPKPQPVKENISLEDAVKAIQDYSKLVNVYNPMFKEKDKDE